MPPKKKRKKDQHVVVCQLGGFDVPPEFTEDGDVTQLLKQICEFICTQHGTTWRESFFQKSLAFELQQRGYDVSMEVAYPVYYTSSTGKQTSVGNVFVDIETPEFAIECKIGKIRDAAVHQSNLYSRILKKPCYLVSAG